MKLSHTIRLTCDDPNVMSDAGVVPGLLGESAALGLDPDLVRLQRRVQMLSDQLVQPGDSGQAVRQPLPRCTLPESSSISRS